MPLVRVSDWPSRLDRFLREHETEPFQYGKWDCCLFACSAIQSMTGTDPAAAFRDVYSSRRAARGEIAKRTGNGSVLSIVEHVTRELQMPPVLPIRAQRGDLAVIERRRDVSLGIISLDGRSVIVISGSGLWRLPRSLTFRAWRV